jgi:diguanylate cyclase (GGDEF)-like protein/PAS domain S-box-containing protein
MNMRDVDPLLLQADETERLAALSAYGVLDTEPEAAFDDFTVIASRVAGTPIALIVLLDAERAWVKSRIGLHATELPRELAFCHHTLMLGDQLEIPDAALDPRFVDNPYVTSAPRLRYYAGTPLRDGQGHAIGTLCVMDVQPRRLPAQALDTLRRLAQQVMHLMELRRLADRQRDIERALRQRDTELARLVLVAERTSHAVVITDAANRITWCNSAFEGFAGRPVAECLGRRPGAVLPFLRTDAHAREPLQRALAARLPARVRTRSEHAGGRRRWVDIDLQPQHRADGSFNGCIAVVSDVSELVAQHEQAQALLQSLPVGVLVYDGQMRVLQANASAARIFGVDAEELLSLNTITAFDDAIDEDGHALPPQQRPAVLTLVDGVSRHDVVYGLRMRHGERRWLRVSTAVTRDAAGTITGVIGCFVDHTEERQQRRLLNLAIEAARIAPWHWDVKNDLVEFDTATATAAGLNFPNTGAGLVRAPLWPAMHREDAERVREEVRRQDLQAQPLPLRVEFRLRSSGGDWRWVLAAGASAERDGSGRVTRMSGVLIDIHERKNAEAALQRAATTDALTGLPNRAVLGDRLEQALRAARRSGRTGALLFIDLDHFKRINDVYGHVVGDRVLQAIGQRLQGELRATDTLARMGGDELMVLLPDLGSDIEAAASGAETAGQKLLSRLLQPLLVDGLEYTLGASIGCTLFPKPGPESAEDLVREADTAMYAAKAAGRGTLRRYEHGMQHNVAERLALERDLRHAIANQEFEVNLQGKWDCAGHLAGAELLLRWTHPQRGAVSPALFIPVAEESSLILTIGRWVIEQACHLLARWQADGRALPLAVNVSPRQFREPGFADDLLEITRATGVPPALLTIEITEGVLLDEGAGQRLAQLAAQGFRFSIDDFGTGYSSLMYLKKLPVHELKIDRAFVRDITIDPEDAAIVQAMIAIGRKFKLDVVAEGVETVEQAEFLRANSCSYLQGYLLGRPMAVPAFESACWPLPLA